MDYDFNKCSLTNIELFFIGLETEPSKINEK